MQRVKLLQQLAKEAKYAKGDAATTSQLKERERLTKTIPDETIGKLMRDRDTRNAQRLTKYGPEFGTPEGALDSALKSLVRRNLISKAEVLSLKADNGMAGATCRFTLAGPKFGSEYTGHVMLMEVGGLWRPAFANVDGEGDKMGIYPELMPYVLRWGEDGLEVTQH